MDWTLVKSINSMSQQGILWATSSRAAENYAEVLKRITTRVVEVINFISNTCALHSPGYVVREYTVPYCRIDLVTRSFGPGLFGSI